MRSYECDVTKTRHQRERSFLTDPSCCPKLGDFGPHLVEIVPNRSQVGRVWLKFRSTSAKLGRLRPKLFQSCSRTGVDQILARSTRCGPIWAKLGMRSNHLHGPHSGTLVGRDRVFVSSLGSAQSSNCDGGVDTYVGYVLGVGCSGAPHGGGDTNDPKS